MSCFDVALVDLGEHLKDVPDRIAKKLNKLQQVYHFTVEGSIPAAVVGEPDCDPWHHVEKLLRILHKHHKAVKYDYVIGLTHVRISKEEHFRRPDGLPSIAELDYFSEVDHDKSAIISINDHLLKHLSPATSKHQYAAFSVVGELLRLRVGVVKEKKYHKNDEGCLFDYCNDLSKIREAILSGTICTKCRAELEEAGIGKNEFSAIESILAMCRKKTGSGSVLARAFASPISNLAIGSGIGWFSSVYITQNHVVAVLALLLSTILGAIAFYWIKDWREHH